MNDRGMSRPVPRWLRLLLLASLGMNLLVIGAVVSAMFGGFTDRQPAAMNTRMALPYTRALSEEDRRVVRRDLRRALFANQEERGVLSQSYIAALEVLRVSPFDQNAFATVMEDQSRTARARMIKGQDILISVISDMSDAERSAFADRLERELQKLETRGKAWKRPFKP